MKFITRSIAISRRGVFGFESSTDKGQTWSYQDLAIESAIFYPPVEVSGSTVAVGAMAAFLSRDKAANWDKVPLGFPSDDWATAMHLINPNTLFVSTYYGRCARLIGALRVGRWRR